MSDVCKWLADEVCVNADSPYCADFCQSIVRPRCCVHFEEQEERNDGNNESKT